MVLKDKPRRRELISPTVLKAANIASIVIIVVLLAAAVLYRIPSNYEMLLPATAESVDPKIYVAGHPPSSGRGQLLMTFVLENRASQLENIFGRLNPDASFEDVPPESQQQQDQQNTQAMISSEQKAELVALCHLGYPQLCSGGVQIGSIEKYSHAGALLRSNDIIVAVDGTTVATPDQLRAALGRKPAGATVALTIQRGRARLVLKAVPTVRSPYKPYGTALGISIIGEAPLTAFPSRLPIDIKIDPGQIGGPSAGLMFTLGVLNRLSTTDLTHGRRIAGTGTISLDGSVGPIGGVKQKVIGAEWTHAQYFIVPRSGGNYDDARKVVNNSMVLVPVDTLDDALAFLHTLK